VQILHSPFESSIYCDMTPEQMAALAGTEWEALLPVADRRPLYVPIEYTNFRLQREGWMSACPHPNLEKAIIERTGASWAQKLKYCATEAQWHYYAGRVRYYNEWNADWLYRFGNHDVYEQYCSDQMAAYYAENPFPQELLPQEPTDQDIVDEINHYAMYY